MKSMYEFMSQFDMSMFTLPGPKTDETIEKEFYPAKNCNFSVLKEEKDTVLVRWTSRNGEIPKKSLSEPVILKYKWGSDRYVCTGKCFPMKSADKSSPV